MREWLLRAAWGVPWKRFPIRTLRALMGDWVLVGNYRAHLTPKGRAWIEAFREGEKSIGGRP